MEKVVLQAGDRIGILNRGEAALRFIRAVNEYNALHGTQLESVAFYLPEEEDAPFVKQAHYAFNLSTLEKKGTGRVNPYLNSELLLKALDSMNCQAAWAGWGFLSEDPLLVEALEQAGLVFLGPPSSPMRLLGDKMAAKKLADETSVPIVPWSRTPVTSLQEASRAAQNIGYPCMIKAAAAGGGRGIRPVLSEKELAEKYNSAREETLRVTGGDRLFMEHLIVNARHLEVQALADQHGRVLTFGVRDCSVQRRNQKIIEETPPPWLDKKQLAEMEAAAVRLLIAAQYESAGTVEFIYDLDTSRYYFMEVNARLQVEHPITEQAYGIDLVQGQIAVARGEKLRAGSKPNPGTVIEARLNAEDPEQGFTPAPGKVLFFRPPAGPGLRVDAGIEQGCTVPSQFDSMIAKIIAYGPNRALALARLERALRELKIKIEGGTTNRAFILELLNNPAVRKGGVSTRFTEDLLRERNEIVKKTNWPAALISAAIEQYLLRHREELLNFKQQMAGTGHPRSLSSTRGLECRLSAQGEPFILSVKAVGPSRYVVQADTVQVIADYQLKGEEAFLMLNNKRFSVQTVARGAGLQVEIDSIPYLIELEAGGTVKAPSPAVIISVPVKPHEKVKKDQVLAVLEAMKMEMLVTAPFAGTVKSIRVKSGEQVAAGQPLLILDAEEKEEKTDQAVSTRRPELRQAVDFSMHKAQSRTEDWDIWQHKYLSLFLGYDFAPEEGNLIWEQILNFPSTEKERRQQLLPLLLKAVSIYLDIERLFSSPPLATENLARTASYRELLSHYFRRQKDRNKGLPEVFLTHLTQALSWYEGIEGSGRGLDEAGLSIFKSHSHLEKKQEMLQRTLFALAPLAMSQKQLRGLADELDEIAALSQPQKPALTDAATNARYQLIDRHQLERWKENKRSNISKILTLLGKHKNNGRLYHKLMQYLVGTGHNLLSDLVARSVSGKREEYLLTLEIISRRLNRDRRYLDGQVHEAQGFTFYISRTEVKPPANAEESSSEGKGSVGVAETWLTISEAAKLAELYPVLQEALNRRTAARTNSLPLSSGKTGAGSGQTAGPEVIVLVHSPARLPREQQEELFNLVAAYPLPVNWLAQGVCTPHTREEFRTYHYAKDGKWQEEADRRGFNPRAYRELRVYRLQHFAKQIIYQSESVYLLLLKARQVPEDERLFALVEVPSARIQFDEAGNIQRMLALENVLTEAVEAMRAEQAKRKRRLYWNRIVIYIHAVLNTTLEQNKDYAARIGARIKEMGLERLSVYSRRTAADGQGSEEVELVFENISGANFTLHSRTPAVEPLLPVDSYTRKVISARQRGTLYPYEIIKMITKTGYQVQETFPKGDFEEFDILPGPTKEGEKAEGTAEATDKAVSVKGRPYGENAANVVFGIVTHFVDFQPQGLKRVLILSDPTQDMGSLAEPECRRIIAALNLAEERNLTVEWLPVSAGARIEMDSGTENLDWTAAVLRLIILFTQNGGEINILVAGINIGAQSYWNAEATMLMHTRGMLIMTEDAAMCLTGKKALDFSGSVSGEDNVDIGGVERIMGPNGQAQVRVKNLYEGYMALFRHYSYTYREPGTLYPARKKTSDPFDRDFSQAAYIDNLGQELETIGDIFSSQKNPERKKPFDMRQLMAALIDQDHPPFERWAAMRDAEVAIVWEASLGGFPVGLIGMESRTLARIGGVPHDGPEAWTGATLFPLSSKKIARAINAYSRTLPLVIIANLSGFDGSPESLRKLQLEYGAEIGRAIVNFKGPILFVVTARYHGGAYVVFSRRLNPHLHVTAVEGAFASVIGGAPAAAVVFPRQVLQNTYADERILEAQARLKADASFNRKEFDALFQEVYTEKQQELAREFDRTHSVERALRVGSLDKIIEPFNLRSYLIKYLETKLHGKEIY